uniref:Galectin n=1 Tax=Sinocyclocheilus rhinocerous TaxID=307959 RepID=A0A673IK72_9TELE
MQSLFFLQIKITFTNEESHIFNLLFCSFAINIGHSAEDIALHMNPRFDAHGDQRTIVCNSLQDGNWCEEHREASFPFNQNEEFQARDRNIFCVYI